MLEFKGLRKSEEADLAKKKMSKWLTTEVLVSKYVVICRPIA
jgi:hypothetical protein